MTSRVRGPSEAPKVDHPRGSRSTYEGIFVRSILLIFILKGLLYVLLLPAWQGPDEPANLSAVAKATPGTLLGPPQTKGVPEGIVQDVERSDFWKRRAWPTDFSGQDEAVFHVDSNFSLYYYVVAPAYLLGATQGAMGALYAVRLMSVLLGAVAVSLTFLLAKESFPDRPWVAPLAAATIALVPQIGFITAVVNKDALAIPLGAATLLVAVRILRLSGSGGRWAAVAGLLLAGVLTKPSLVALLVPVVLALAMSSWGTLSRWSRLALTAALPVILAITVGVPLLLGRNSVFGDVFLIQRDSLIEGVSLVFSGEAWLYVLPQAWGHFGWVNAPLPTWLYLVLFALTAAAALGVLFTWLVRRDRALSKPILTLTAAMLAFAFVTMFAQAAFVRTQGRFLFPVAPAFAALLALGMGVLVPWLRRPYGVAVWVGAGVGLNLWVLLVMFPARFGAL